MSWFEHREVMCPRCGARCEARIADSVNVSSLPHVRGEILRGEFHRPTCAHCAAVFFVETRFLYSDLASGILVQVEPPSASSAWAEAEARFSRTLREAEHGPPAAQLLLKQARARLVFGLRALVEKLQIWDAGLDDRVVEDIKRSLVVAMAAAPTELRLAGADDAAIALAGVDAQGGALSITVERATYQAIARGAVTSELWVDWRRPR